MARLCLKGIPVSPGIAIGPLRLQDSFGGGDKRQLDPTEVDAEIDLLNMAIKKVRKDLGQMLEHLPANLDDYREILASQLALAEDAKILEGIRARIERRQICASWALEEVILELCSIFGDLDDPYLRDRVQDIKGLGKRLANALGGVSATSGLGKDAVAALREITPADVMQLKMEGANGILSGEGGLASHAAILARGLQLPAVFGVSGLFTEGRSNELAIVDSPGGQVILDPAADELEYYRHRQKIYSAFVREARAAARWPARTRDGKKISVLANLENTEELPALKGSGAEGIGLYRTEFAFFGGIWPDEDCLYREYSTVLTSLAPQKVVFRIMDVGADKILPLQEALREPNPALGLRGIRFCLKRKDIFATQIRAILRAACNGNAAIMLPMVSTVAELEESRKFIEELKFDLRCKNAIFAEEIPLGVMVETPASVMICDELAKKCDFLSIGTNDLLHYLMAIDRDNCHVAYLHDALHPAFLRSIKMLVEAAAKNDAPLSVCGEIASDPLGVALLVGLGITSLSTAPQFTPALKHMLRKLDSRLCVKLADAALHETDTAKTRENLRASLQICLGQELSFYNTLII